MMCVWQQKEENLNCNWKEEEKKKSNSLWKRNRKKKKKKKEKKKKERKGRTPLMCVKSRKNFLGKTGRKELAVLASMTVKNFCMPVYSEADEKPLLCVCSSFHPFIHVNKKAWTVCKQGRDKRKTGQTRTWNLCVEKGKRKKEKKNRRTQQTSSKQVHGPVCEKEKETNNST